MWCRFAVFAFFCIAAGGCISDKEAEHGGDKSQGGSPVSRERNSGGKGQPAFDNISTSFMTEGHPGGFYEGSSSGSGRNHDRQHVSTSEYNPVQNSQTTGHQSNYGEDYSSGRPTGQSNNGKTDIHYTDHPSRPLGESTHNRPVRPSYEGAPTDGPLYPSSVVTEEHSLLGNGNEPGRPAGSSFHRPSNGQGSLTEKSPHATDQVGGATGFRPDNAGEHSFGRPTEFASLANQDNKRPTGGSSHGQGESHSPVGSTPYQITTGQDEQSETSHNKETGNEGKEEDKDVCFPNLGCFKMGKPWKSILRPIGPPQGPEKIQTTIHFYSRANLEHQKNITVHPQINMGQVRFDPSKITAIIVHGFSNSGNATWMKDMKNVYLNKVDANVMIVDWGKGAQLLNYLQVAGNTRVVGKQLGLFVKYLMQNYGADPGKFHLIGHSLGAQICSYLAKEVPGMARLTALDPAQPGFEGFDSELRLDKTDAEFVDVIHTDARPFIPTLGFGMITPHGHVDFYMNGGFDQPGCIPPPKKELPVIKNFLDLAKYPVEVITKTVACPHGRAYEYLIEAFNETEKCIFWGHKADVKNVFKSVTNTVTQGLLKKFTALSTTCSKEDCIPVGFATKKSPLRGVFVVTTASKSPYCISEPGIPPETPPQERQRESFIQKIGKKTGFLG